MGAWAVDLFTDRQRADFWICSSHSNPLFCVPSYRLGQGPPSSAQGSHRILTWALPLTLGDLRQIASENKFTASALLTCKRLLGSWHDALLWGSRAPLPFHACRHRCKWVEGWGAWVPTVLGLPFHQDWAPFGPEWGKMPRCGGYTVFCTKSSSFTARDLEKASSAQHWSPAVGAAKPHVKMWEANTEDSGFISTPQRAQ